MRKIIFAALLTLLSTAASAKDINCATELTKALEETDPTKRPTNATLATCLMKIQEALNKKAEATSTVIPTGAVMAFDRECPEGWSRYEPAASRVLVGASTLAELDNGPAILRSGSNGAMLNQRPLGSHGGTEQVTLKEDQLPSHNHAVRMVGGVGLPTGPTPYLLHSGGVEASTQDTGKGEPINNMPPYLALQFCRKG